MLLIFSLAMCCAYSQDLDASNDKLDSDQTGMQKLKTASQGNDNNIIGEKPSSGNDDSKAHLILDNDADKENIYLGDYVTWIISAENRGPDTAKNVKVFDQLPDGLKYVKHTATKGTFNPKTGIWDVGNLSVDDGEVFLNILTKSFSTGEKINKAKLTSDTTNLNDDESFEEEEIDVFESHETSNSDAAYKSAHTTMHPTANPIGLIAISLFGILIAVFKNRS